MTSVCFQGKQINITVIQVDVLTNNAEEAEVEWFYEDLQDVRPVRPVRQDLLNLELTPAKDIFFIVGD